MTKGRGAIENAAISPPSPSGSAGRGALRRRCCHLAAAIDTPVSVGETAAEGGPWGKAVLAAFAVRRGADQSLTNHLDTVVFRGWMGRRRAAPLL